MPGAATNAALVQFPKATGGSETATHFAIGTASSGTGKILFRKALTSNLAISTNVQPQFPAGDLDITFSGDAGNSFLSEIAEHILNNADIALVGDATGLRGSSTAGSLYVSLHTADPGASGDQTTNECAYTSYARVAVARSGSAWTVS